MYNYYQESNITSPRDTPWIYQDYERPNVHIKYSLQVPDIRVRNHLYCLVTNTSTQTISIVKTITCQKTVTEME